MREREGGEGEKRCSSRPRRENPESFPRKRETNSVKVNQIPSRKGSKTREKEKDRRALPRNINISRLFPENTHLPPSEEIYYARGAGGTGSGSPRSDRGGKSNFAWKQREKAEIFDFYPVSSRGD